jgi:hypothetical protein
MPEATFRLVPALSTHALARLKRNEAAQRAETKRRGLPAVFVSVEALWLLYAGKCCCSLVRGEAGCNFMAMDPEGVGQEPDAPVIAHVYLRKRRGGHDPENTRLWRHQCNQAFAAVERHDTALGDRMALDFTRKLLAPEERPRSSIKSAGFRKHPHLKRKIDGTVVSR